MTSMPPPHSLTPADAGTGTVTAALLPFGPSSSRAASGLVAGQRGGVHGQSVDAALDEPAQRPPVDPPGARDLGGEAGPPVDGRAAVERGQVDVRPIAPQRQAGEQCVAEAP